MIETIRGVYSGSDLIIGAHDAVPELHLEKGKQEDIISGAPSVLVQIAPPVDRCPWPNPAGITKRARALGHSGPATLAGTAARHKAHDLCADDGGHGDPRGNG